MSGGTNNASSAYVTTNSIVVGFNNALTKFISLGTVTAIGYSEDLKNIPLEDFGNFRPLAGSYLKGGGKIISGITTDLDGNPRGTPPTIGAYEFVSDELPAGYAVSGSSNNNHNGLYEPTAQTHNGKPVFSYESDKPYYIFLQDLDGEALLWVLSDRVQDAPGPTPQGAFFASGDYFTPGTLEGEWQGEGAHLSETITVAAQGDVWTEQ